MPPNRRREIIVAVVVLAGAAAFARTQGLLDRQFLPVLVGVAVVVALTARFFVPPRRRVVRKQLTEWSRREGVTLIDFEEHPPAAWPHASFGETYWKTELKEGNVFRVKVRDRGGRVRQGWLLHADYAVHVMGGGIAEVHWDAEPT